MTRCNSTTQPGFLGWACSEAQFAMCYGDPYMISTCAALVSFWAMGPNPTNPHCVCEVNAPPALPPTLSGQPTANPSCTPTASPANPTAFPTVTPTLPTAADPSTSSPPTWTTPPPPPPPPDAPTGEPLPLPLLLLSTIATTERLAPQGAGDSDSDSDGVDFSLIVGITLGGLLVVAGGVIWCQRGQRAPSAVDDRTRPPAVYNSAYAGARAADGQGMQGRRPRLVPGARRGAAAQYAVVFDPHDDQRYEEPVPLTEQQHEIVYEVPETKKMMNGQQRGGVKVGGGTDGQRYEVPARHNAHEQTNKQAQRLPQYQAPAMMHDPLAGNTYHVVRETDWTAPTPAPGDYAEIEWIDETPVRDAENRKNLNNRKTTAERGVGPDRQPNKVTKATKESSA